MKSTTEIENALQLLRTLKLSQVRKQLEKDSLEQGQYFGNETEDWVPRSTIIYEFLKDAKEQS